MKERVHLRGLITMTIVGVRDGWKCQDACISELRLEGYQGTADMMGAWVEDEPHVSLVYPAQSDEWGYPPYDNPDGLGSDGLEPGESCEYTHDPDGNYGYSQSGGGNYAYTQDPDYLDGETVERLRAFADTVYKIQTRHTGAEDAEIHAEDLYSFTHAGVLNWYQAKTRDERISYGEVYNYAFEADLKEIAGELFDTITPADNVQAMCDFFGAIREGEMIRMNAEGNAWNQDTYYLREPASAGQELGKTVLIGAVMEYNPYAQSYVQVKVYHALFDQDPSDANVFRQRTVCKLMKREYSRNMVEKYGPDRALTLSGRLIMQIYNCVAIPWYLPDFSLLCMAVLCAYLQIVKFPLAG